MELVTMVYYRVEEGDTFESIAKKFFGERNRFSIFTGVSKLISLNTDFMEGGPRSKDVIFTGELIRIK